MVAVIATLSMTLVGEPFLPEAVARTEPCHPNHKDWPDCLPTEGQLTAAVRTQPNRAYFWTGRIRDEAGDIARSFGGTTLEMAIDSHRLRMPDINDPRSQLGDERWEHASREMARQAAGIVYVVVGHPDNVRPGNIWETQERPRVQANPDVTAIIEITERTGDERVIWRQQGVTERQVERERAREHARRACPVWQQAGWPSTSSTTSNTQTPAPTLSPTRTDEVLVGGETNEWDTLYTTTTRYYSAVPTHSLPESRRHDYLQSTPVLQAVFKPRATRPSYFYLRLAANEHALYRLWPGDLGCEEGDGGHTELKKRDFRVMPLGDSITYGEESTDRNGYRDELYDYLKQSVRSVDFVGSVRAGSMGDPDNEGHPGDRIHEIADFADCSVKRYQPNVITLHAGTNDMNRSYQLASAPDRLKKLINQALTDSPRATVLVAKLIPTAKPGLQPRIDAYNAALPGVVEGLQREGKHVLLVDMGRVRVSDGLQNDAHPTDEGYAKMADAWDRGMWEAYSRGWIKDPAAQQDEVKCGDPDDGDSGETALGRGWRKLGVIAPGYGGEPGRTVMAELNGDQRADYVQVYGDGSFRASVNTVGTPGKPDWVDAGTYQPGRDANADHVRFADLDGDGRDDFLVVSSDSVVGAYLNRRGADGKLTFQPWGVVFKQDSFGRDHLRFADITGDGRDDILRVSDEGAVHAYVNRGDTAGGPSDKPQHPNWHFWPNWAGGTKGSSLEAVRFADVDRDGKADYLQVGEEGDVHAFLNRRSDGKGSFTAVHDWAHKSHYSRSYVQFADISGDGRADYLVVYRGGSVRAWLNRGGNGNPDAGPPGGIEPPPIPPPGGPGDQPPPPSQG
ncbi:FG-GAP-like repeat-containing protein [Streptomyces buecherae]|uniref:FG-GAP-like repeat-containing protein n=1 Tax=Streptomyces buecherae TaxID=2763006 RepID=UPI0033D89E0F